MTSGLKSTRDVSMISQQPGPGMSHDTLFMCGHRTHRTGATWRNPGGVGQLWVRCGACNAARKKPVAVITPLL